jgi:pimeloyl-ACP methyl ester carboxylesterase
MEVTRSLAISSTTDLDHASRREDGQVSERIIQENGLEIATEAFGDPVHTPVLLNMGGMASMLWWPEEFCARLASHGRYDIRYDQRDTDLTKFPPGEATYTFNDTVDDAFRVLDGYPIPAAHLVGMSVGAMIGQVAALKYPSRVLSLTAISSSQVATDKSHLPTSSEASVEHIAAGENVDWSDRSQVIDYMVKESRVFAGTAHPFDEAETRAFVERDFDRTGGYPSETNQAAFKVGEEWRGRLQEIKALLLVIHGTADPVYRVQHGVPLSQSVPSAKLVLLEGGGHELHRAAWHTIIDAIARHTSPKLTAHDT